MHPELDGNVQVPTGPEDSSAAPSEDAKFGSSRGTMIDLAVGAGFGATR
jgi:hypothetical protein